MNLLALECSTPNASLALLSGSDVLTRSDPQLTKHAQWILPAVQCLLAEAGLSMAQLDGIIFGQGPGSFTGIRIACSIAKGLAYAHDYPLYPVSSLHAIVSECRHQYPQYATLPMLSVVDASMNQLYWSVALEDMTEACVSSTGDMEIAVMDQMSKSFSDHPNIILAGVGFAAYWEQMSSVLQAVIVQQCEINPTAAAMIRLVKAGGIAPTTAEQALPLYVRNQVTQGPSQSQSVKE